MSSSHRVATEREATVRVLVADPGLAAWLNPQERAAAERTLVAPVEVAAAGPWRPALAGERGMAALLVLDGLIVRELSLRGASSVALLGAGDVLLSVPRQPDSHEETRVSWTVVEPARVAWLDGGFTEASRRWPVLGLALAERVERRSQQAAALHAIGRLVRVDDRILALLTHLGARWGTQTPEGTVLESPLQHGILARLVGCRRESVTAALAALHARGAVVRQPDGTWLLPGATAHDAPVA